jgi:hypothetical protein
MKSGIQFFLVLLLLGCSTHNNGLPHECVALDQYVPVLKKLRNIEWSDLDRNQVKALWDRKLDEDYGCSISRDGMTIPCMGLIDGPCDVTHCCGILFSFEIPTNQREKLNDVIITVKSTHADVLSHAAQQFEEVLSPLAKEPHTDDPVLGWEEIDPKIVDDVYTYKTETGDVEIAVWILLGKEPDGSWLLHLSMGPRD